MRPLLVQFLVLVSKWLISTAIKRWSSYNWFCSLAATDHNLKIMKVVLSKDSYTYKFSVDNKVFRVEVFREENKIGEWYTTKPSSHIPLLVEHVLRSDIPKDFPSEVPSLLIGYFNMSMFHKLNVD